MLATLHLLGCAPRQAAVITTSEEGRYRFRTSPSMMLNITIVARTRKPPIEASKTAIALLVSTSQCTMRWRPTASPVPTERSHSGLVSATGIRLARKAPCEDAIGVCGQMLSMRVNGTNHLDRVGLRVFGGRVEFLGHATPPAQNVRCDKRRAVGFYQVPARDTLKRPPAAPWRRRIGDREVRTDSTRP